MQLTPNRIKQALAGQSFLVSDSSLDAPLEFEFPNTFDGWPRRGGEGIVVPVLCKHPQKGDIPSVIKLFDQEVPERIKRQNHLAGSGLSDAHEWLYEGVPYAWVDEKVAGHQISASVAKQVCHNGNGDDFQIVRARTIMDNFTEDNRRAMARQLCDAITELERRQIVHSDLSPGNVIIEKRSVDDARSVLIDYDNFRSPNVPMLPRRHEGRQVRTLGSIGYQHPSLMRRIRQDNREDDNLFVENDRFALGVLCLELMTLTTHIEANLVDRPHLLNAHELEQGRLDVPKGVEATWPDGFKLLAEAVKEPDVNSLPGPEDWLGALGFMGQGWHGLDKDWTSTPLIKIFQQRGNLTPTRVKRVHFVGSSGSGDFQKMVDTLSWISYSYENVNGCCVRCTIDVHSSALVLMKRDGVIKQLGVNPGEIEVHPGDRVLVDGWALEFQDASLGTNW